MIRVKHLTALIIAVLLLICCLSSCDDSSNSVMMVADFKISKDEYLYFWNNHRKAHPDADSEVIKKLCESSLREAYSLWKLANDNGYKFSDDDNKKVDEYLSQALDMYGGEEAFNEALSKANMTESVFTEEMKRQTLEISLRNYMMDEKSAIIKSDDKTVEEDISKNFYRILQIYIANDEGESIEENKELSQSVYKQLSDGASFEELSAKYNEDEAQPQEGYCFTYGQMLKEIEDNTLRLDIGEISPVFESEGGYHIIKRLEITKEYRDKNFETLRYYYQCRIFNEKRESTAENMEIKYLSSYNDLTLK